MTIEFNCPECNAIIAFDSKHAGKRARCSTCGQKLIIPHKSFEKAEKVKPPPEIAVPLPGFYHALFIDTWKLFINPENTTTLVFVIAAVFFKFFLAKGACCLGFISHFVIWGWLLGFYLNIISETADSDVDDNTLPQIYLGAFPAFLWNIIKPFLIFSLTLLVVQAPLLILLAYKQDEGVTIHNIWQLHTDTAILARAFFFIGLFFFPIAILIVAIETVLTLLRPARLLSAIFRAFVPYLVITSSLAAFALLEIKAQPCDFTGQAAFFTNIANLILNLIVQLLAIIAMRAIGLFYRHYNCYLKV